jgi:hypothetical protein
MTLQERLDAMRAGFEATAPSAAREIMHRATEDLRASGAAGRAVGMGQVFPAFALESSAGEEVRSEDLLARGPLVLTFFRGQW